MNFLRIFLFLFVLVPLFSVVSYSQSSVLSGTVFDLAGRGIPNVKISVRDAKGKLVREVKSGESGAFSISLNEGWYSLACKADGFIEMRITRYNVSSSRDLRMDIVLIVNEFSDGEPALSSRLISYENTFFGSAPEPRAKMLR
jgi:hypothetical protein